MDDLMPMTSVAGDTTNDVTDESTHAEQGVQGDVVVLAQPAQDRLITPVILSSEDPPIDIENPLAPSAQKPLPKDDENAFVQDVQNPIV